MSTTDRPGPPQPGIGEVMVRPRLARQHRRLLALRRPLVGLRLGVALVLALAGVLFATSAGNARGSDLRPSEPGNLADLIRAEQARGASLQRRVEAMRAGLATGTEAAAGRDAVVGRVWSRIGALSPVVGLLPAQGPGLQVTLDDAPRSRRQAVADHVEDGGTSSPDDYVVHQQDLQAVVNALWSGGAEAVQLMDQRLVSTSAVRCVGNTLLLHGQVYSPPYIVRAVGSVQDMQRALAESGAVLAYRDAADRFGLGYDVAAAESLVLPGYTGSLELRHATVVRP